MRDAVLPIVLVVLGTAWLLNSLHWLPEVHWVWILGLASAGVAILVLEGITKSSIVAGPLLILAGILSFLRQYQGLEWRFIVPVMLIAAGIFMLIARTAWIPESRRFTERTKRSIQDGEDHG